MKKIIISFFVILSFIFVYLIFYKGLSKSNLYVPKNLNQDIPKFTSITFFEKKEINSKDIFKNKNFYLLNIWSSWCVPCRAEHSFLVDLSKINELELIGINYKDNFENAQKFINELGNPFKKILIDKDGTIAIGWGAFGVPESYLIYDNKVIKRYIGPLNLQSVEEIKNFLK